MLLDAWGRCQNRDSSVPSRRLIDADLSDDADTTEIRAMIGEFRA